MAVKSEKKKSGGAKKRSPVVERSEPDSPQEHAEDEDQDAELMVPGHNLIGTAAAVPAEELEPEFGTAQDLGTSKYVHAAFFSAGILAAYVSTKLLLTAWNRLAEWPDAVRIFRFLLAVGENERQLYTSVGGVIIGAVATIYTYRKEEVRHWADEVALELSKVTWPDRETVRNGTLVVIAASLVATLYVMLLDRFWAFLTSLIYET